MSDRILKLESYQKDNGLYSLRVVFEVRPQQSPYEFKNVESKTKEGVFKLLGPKIEDGTSTLKDRLSNAKDEDKVKIWKEYFRLIDTK